MNDTQITARLFLHAVLPSLATLARLDKEAGDAIKNMNSSLQFCIPTGPAVVLNFDNGKISSMNKRVFLPDLMFSFVNAAHLVNLFKENKGFPILWKGFWRLKDIKGFTALTKRLEYYMQIADDTTKTPTKEEQEVLVPLLMDIALRGVNVLAQYDHHAIRIANSLKTATAKLTVKPDGPTRFISKSEAGFVLSEAYNGDPDAIFTFNKLETAMELLTGKLDNMAALGLEQITIRGMVMFIDGIGAIMARLDKYLK